MKLKNFPTLILVFGLPFSISTTALAQTQTSQTSQTLPAITQQALLSNPEILSRWQAYQAARNERDVISGGLRPRVDFSAGVGRERLREQFQDADFNRHSAALTLTQLLYDGSARKNEIQQSHHQSMVRLFEFYNSSETVALEVTRAFFDVLRYRKLLALAEDNYVQHKAVYEQIQNKVKAGVARRVDLEQAAGRLALSDANLVTEGANLYDVSTRFQRVVGILPDKDLKAEVILERDLPPTAVSALRAAISRHPGLRAAIENVRSAEAAAKGQQANYSPRFDLRLSSQYDNHLNGRSGSRRDNLAQVVMSWNLYNGGSDRSKIRQYADLLNQAYAERDRACVDVRQNLSIAYNEARKQAEQLTYLDQHQLAIDKAKQAYRKQFEIGQRTLLDVLDTENELFQARRSYTNAEYDLQIAYARAHAGYGDLVQTLNSKVKSADELANELPDVLREPLGDAVARCAPETPDQFPVNKEALDQRARDLIKNDGLSK